MGKVRVSLKREYNLQRHCAYCGKDFKSSIVLARHIYNKHKNTYAYNNLLEIVEING